ncbi:capsular associated protein [Calocera cornea HHB12733]|uniref:Capsular associated protein n=1 Tax=Calocera cornea HHB12733 TaxID=1353952 RepID=A0A165D300_9BASI|nr:capsular associated protein [Calocera cornea HHB12733]
MALPLLRSRLVTRILILIAGILFLRYLFGGRDSSREIRSNSVFERVAISGNVLDVQRYPFLQARIDRDERPDILDEIMDNGVNDFWNRFQLPFMTSPETSQIDAQIVRSAVDELLSLNGWVAAACPTLIRPFGQKEGNYEEISDPSHLYFIAIVIHSADHFLVDQLAVIVQMARRMGTHNLFVSMLDYDSQDATQTLTDLCEAIFVLLGIPFRIRRVSAMTEDPSAAYYPLEEAHTRNLVLEPLRELYEKRNIKFHRVIWLKGFTCPNDIFETIKVSQLNDAAMVCGMDWAEHNGFFIFSDRWRTRDMDGDQFRQSKSSSNQLAGPPRDAVGSARYAQHLPFQVFCCESGTHIIDPAQSYYRGIKYRSGTQYHNTTAHPEQPEPKWDARGDCQDSSQAYFCRDLWVEAAKDPGAEARAGEAMWDQPRQRAKRQELEEVDPAGERRADDDPAQLAPPMQANPGPDAEPDAAPNIRKPVKDSSDPDANVGSDFDAMPESQDDPALSLPNQDEQVNLAVPNSAFRPARILINPRCVTTYAGVSHTQLALDLFGGERESSVADSERSKYILDDWEGAPDSFVCQEQRRTGGRKATKTQRRLAFSVFEELQRRGF